MRGKSPEKDRSERYLLTYADLMNLLLILFIVLFCSASKDMVKVSEVMTAIQKGFVKTSSVAASSTSSAIGTGNASSGTAQPTSDYSEFYDQLIALLKQRGIINKVDITQSRNEVIISLKDNVLFDPGKADLGSDAQSLLTNIGGLIKKISFGQLIIEGHTDSDPIHTYQFQDNRQLSLIRAYNVSKVFEQAGVNPKKILPVGYGEYFPVAKNDTPENKAKNRRVVLTILKQGVTPADESVTTKDLVTIMQNAANNKPESSAASESSGESSSTGTVISASGNSAK